jgi:pimeloyl-ACP methyl ester carboxylesterase
MEPIFENREGWLRIYPDLPGMGRTKGGNWITSTDQMLAVVLEFIEQVIPEQPLLSWIGQGIGYR